MTKDPGVLSLSDYVNQRPSHHAQKPWFETLPPDVQEEVWAAWKSGVRVTPIVEWLKLKGFSDATKGKVNSYLAIREDG